MWLHKIIEWVQLREMNVSLYLSIYKYTYSCTYTYVYTYIQISISIYSHMYLNADGLCAGLYIICIYIYVYIHTSVGQVIHQSMYEILIQQLLILNQCISHGSSICTYSVIHICIFIYVYILNYTHTHINIFLTLQHCRSMLHVQFIVIHAGRYAYMHAVQKSRPASMPCMSYMQGDLYICMQPCIYAGRHAGMHICKQFI